MILVRYFLSVISDLIFPIIFFFVIKYFNYLINDRFQVAESLNLEMSAVEDFILCDSQVSIKLF